MKFTGLTIIGLGIVLISCMNSQGAVIGQQLNSVADLDLSGDIIYAINFGNNGEPTVGGVIFHDEVNYPEITLNASYERTMNLFGPGPNTGDAGLNTLLNGAAYNLGFSGSVYMSFSAGGLEVGRQYLLQTVGYTANDSGGTDCDMYVEGQMVFENVNPLAAQGGVFGRGGAMTKYDFIATDTTMNVSAITHDGYASGISGFILTLLPRPNPDLNDDYVVNFKDYCILADCWHSNEESADMAPPVRDGIVDLQDLATFAGYWLTDFSLIAHWKLNETHGVVAFDSIGGKDGELHGDPNWQPIDSALELDGVNDYIEIPSVLNPADSSFSIFAWIKTDTPGKTIISQAGIDGKSWLAIDGAGRLVTNLQGSGRNDIPLPPGLCITDNQWHRVGLTWDGEYRTLYIDDVEVSKDTSQQGIKSNYGGLHIGADKTLSEDSFFSGLIDDVKIHNRAVEP